MIKPINPKVSIGLPVYNGEKYLEEALDSILAQTYTDFELIISDNASSDHTPEICIAYANKDPRIRYVRNEKNQGAAWNFNRVFELSVGEYFKWAAHDDILDPEFLFKCVEVLDQDPSVVLCYSKAQVIDEHGKFLENYELNLNIDSSKPHLRFHNLLHGHRCYEIFGVIRASALRRTPLIGNYAFGDSVLLARLGLLGRMYELPEYLFIPRKHELQSQSLFYNDDTKRLDSHSYTTWFDTQKKGKIIFPHWKALGEYYCVVLHAPIKWHERIYCYLFIMNWMRRWRRQMIRDLIIAANQIIQQNYYITLKENETL